MQKLRAPLWKGGIRMSNKLKIVGAVLSILFGIFGIADGATTLKEIKDKS